MEEEEVVEEAPKANRRRCVRFFSGTCRWRCSNP